MLMFAINQQPLRLAILFGIAAFIGGCGNPSEDAAQAAAEAANEWRAASTEIDPLARIDLYNQVITDIDEIAADYADTPTGQAIAAGRDIGFLSLPDMKAARDDFAARAPCYANPTAQCLTTFASRSFGGNSSADNKLLHINQIVCEEGFAAASDAIEHLKINKPAYAEQLLNIAQQAASCGNNDAIQKAINGYIANDPTLGATRVTNLLRIISTQGLEAGWPAALDTLEKLLGAEGPAERLDENTQATATLMMAIAYAGAGNTESALAKYRHFTQALGYAADLDSRLALASNLILANAAGAALPIARETQNTAYNSEGQAVQAVHEAAAIIGRRAKVIDANMPMPQIIGLGDMRKIFGSIGADEAARATKDAAILEAVLDSMAPTATREAYGVGNPGVEGGYLILALVYQKAGDSAKADAAIGKAAALRQRLLAGNLAAQGLNDFALVRTLVALAQGKPEAAVAYAKDVAAQNYIGPPIALEFARKGNSEQALIVASQFGVDLRSYQQAQPIVQALIEAGEVQKADEVIAALPMDANVRGAFYWEMVAKAAKDGQSSEAEKIANDRSLVNTPADRLRLLHVFMNAKEIASDADTAEPIIREIFTIGQQLDANGDRMYAQEAARQAFANGFVDLGIELYTNAARKDQTPLFAAFRDGLSASELTALLMLAHDNLAGESRGYVIDAAIRHLSASH